MPTHETFAAPLLNPSSQQPSEAPVFTLTHVRANELRPGDVIVAHRTLDLVVCDYVQALRTVADVVHVEARSHVIYEGTQAPDVWELMAYPVQADVPFTIVAITRHHDVLMTTCAAWLRGMWDAQYSEDSYEILYQRALAVHGPYVAYAWSQGYRN